MSQRDAALTLVLIIILGVAVREQNFRRLGYTNRDAFPIESAQRYHYIRSVAQGKGIPKIDRALQRPEGFNTRTDTIAQEYLTGYTYRLLTFTGLTLEGFLRFLLRLFWVFTVIPIYLIGLQITGSRSKALLSPLLFALSMPSLRRSLGNEIYREHIAFLPLGFHIYYLLRAMGCAKERKPEADRNYTRGNEGFPYCSAMLSGLFLLLSLVTWKVNSFYYLTLVAFFFLMMLFRGRLTLAIKILGIYALMNLAASLFLNTPLKYDKFPFSPGMALTYALVGAGYVHLKWKRKRITVAVFAVGFAAFWLLRPETGYYSHVWQTFFARLRYFTKPADPSLLHFEARHYWVPPYTSPTAFMFLNDFLFPLLVASVGGAIYAKRLLKTGGTVSEGLLLYLLLASLGFYLLFYKLMTFPIFFASIFLSISLKEARQLSAGWRKLTIALALLALGISAYQSQTWEDGLLSRGLKRAGFKPLFIPQAVPDGATEELINWFKENTGKDQVVLAEFPVSLALLAYAERPIALHALFEGENRFRFREFSFSLFGSEEQLYNIMKKYGARLFVYSAHFLLRTDSNMSYRYISNAMVLDKSWVSYSMHFRPESLKYFTLVYQNSAYRVFRLLEEGEQPTLSARAYAPVFDEGLMEGLRFNTPSGVTREEAFLYTIVSAHSQMREGKRLLTMGQREAGTKLLSGAIEAFPFIPEAHTALAIHYASLGDLEKASIHTEKADALNAGRWQSVVK